MKKSFNILAIASLALFASPVWAAPQSGAQQGQLAGKIFDAMDSNHDGEVSREEFDAANDRRFRALDSNHDGRISREEMDAALQKQAGRVRDRFKQRFDAADANHDGVLSRSEAEQMPGVAQHFDEIDANHDGQVTQREIAAAFKSARRARQQPQ